MKYNEFIDFFDQDRSKYIVSFANKQWFLKQKRGQGENRERLAFLLANGKLNIPKIRSITESELKNITEKHQAVQYTNNSDKNYWLVRLAQEYTSADLPIKNLEEAVAAEMVFSVLIRRRDMCILQTVCTCQTVYRYFSIFLKRHFWESGNWLTMDFSNIIEMTGGISQIYE